MKLSMQILADGLSQYEPEAEIKTNNRCLQNVRMFSEELQFSASTVYLMPMKVDRVVCSNGNDILTLHTDDINGVLNDILDLIEHYNEMENKIQSMITGNCSAGELLKELSDRTGFLFLMADATFYIREFYGPDKILAAHHNLEQIVEKRMLPLEELKQINASPNIRRADISSYLLSVPNIGSAMITNLFSRNMHRGWLVTCKESFTFTQGEKDLIDNIGGLVSEWLETDVGQEERSQKAGIFLDLLQGTVADRPLERLEAFGWYDEDEKQIYVIKHSQNALLPLQTLSNFFELDNNGLFTLFYEDVLVLIVDYALLDRKQFSRLLLSQLDAVGYTAGESPVFSSVVQLKDNYQAAKLAEDYAEKIGRENLRSPILRFQESIIPYAVSLLKEHSAADLKHPALAILQRYDAAHNTQFYTTLQVFLEENCSHSAAAKRLFIHRSTLIYRIEKIAEMTGIDFAVADERFHLLLSYYLNG